jgi:hypothetical protein
VSSCNFVAMEGCEGRSRRKSGYAVLKVVRLRSKRGSFVGLHLEDLFTSEF